MGGDDRGLKKMQEKSRTRTKLDSNPPTLFKSILFIHSCVFVL